MVTALFFSLGWISLDGNSWKIDFLLISWSFFPVLQMAFLLKATFTLFFLPVSLSCSLKHCSFYLEGPSSSLSLSLPADYDLKPPFPILHLQGFVQSTVVIKEHWWARLSVIYNVLGSAEVFAKIAFIIFWTHISNLIYLKGAYLHVAFDSVNEKCLYFTESNYSYQCCSLDLLYLWGTIIETTAGRSSL